MASVYLSPVGGAGAQFFDNNGSPLTGGKLYTYAAGTTTPQPSYTAYNGNTFHTNPIILNAAGRVPDSGEIWLNVAPYKFVLKDTNDVLIATYDNIFGYNVASSTPQDFTGNGTTTSFTLSAAPFNKNALNIYINGVYQNKNVYSVSGTTLTFSEAPPSSTVIEVMYTIYDAAPQNITGDGATTSYTLNVTPTSGNAINIYINGVYQNKNTYTVTGSTLTFSSAPPSGDVVEILFN